jgi:predicted transcriptional regulator
MADDVQDDIENELNQIASATERSGNMKKELKQTIYQSVSKLRKLFVTLT